MIANDNARRGVLSYPFGRLNYEPSPACSVQFDIKYPFHKSTLVDDTPKINSIINEPASIWPVDAPCPNGWLWRFVPLEWMRQRIQTVESGQLTNDGHIIMPRELCIEFSSPDFTNKSSRMSHFTSCARQTISTSEPTGELLSPGNAVHMGTTQKMESLAMSYGHGTIIQLTEAWNKTTWVSLSAFKDSRGHHYVIAESLCISGKRIIRQIRYEHMSLFIFSMMLHKMSHHPTHPIHTNAFHCQVP